MIIHLNIAFMNKSHSQLMESKIFSDFFFLRNINVNACNMPTDLPSVTNLVIPIFEAWDSSSTSLFTMS